MLTQMTPCVWHEDVNVLCFNQVVDDGQAALLFGLSLWYNEKKCNTIACSILHFEPFKKERDMLFKVVHEHKMPCTYIPPGLFILSQ